MLRLTAFILVIAATAGLSGCRQDMQDQPRMFPQRGTAFFADGRSVRLQLANTVARGQLQEDSYFYTGLENGKEGNAMPFPVTMAVLERGQERFNVYCSPCHSRVGNGEGRIVERGYYHAANFHTLRLREAPAGHFFNVITRGYGAMPDYHAELSPADRWAVVAYIRALQLSQNATNADAATGASIASLKEVANKEGLPDNFAEEDWLHPAKPLIVPSAPVASQSAAAPAPVMTAAVSAAKPVSQEGGASQSGSKPEEKSSQSEQKPTAGEQPPAAAPAEAAGDAAAGKDLYTQNCQICHQANRQGIPPLIPALEGVVAKVGTAKIRHTITNGVPTATPPMPSFGGKFSATDIDNIIAFLKTKP